MATKSNIVMQAIELAGGRRKVAETFKISTDAVRQWTLPGRRVPAECVPKLSQMSGISRFKLRPDIYGKIE